LRAAAEALQKQGGHVGDAVAEAVRRVEESSLYQGSKEAVSNDMMIRTLASIADSFVPWYRLTAQEKLFTMHQSQSVKLKPTKLLHQVYRKL
jgi:hypothetical protein